MQNSILPSQETENDELESLSPESIAYYATLLSDFKSAMSAHAADRFLKVDNGTVKRAYLRGEIEAYRLPGTKVPKFTPLALARWLDTHCRCQEIKPLPG